jgi:hypothetical protein
VIVTFMFGKTTVSSSGTSSRVLKVAISPLCYCYALKSSFKE